MLCLLSPAAQFFTLTRSRYLAYHSSTHFSVALSARQQLIWPQVVRVYSGQFGDYQRTLQAPSTREARLSWKVLGSNPRVEKGVSARIISLFLFWTCKNFRLRNNKTKALFGCLKFVLELIGPFYFKSFSITWLNKLSKLVVLAKIKAWEFPGMWWSYSLRAFI